MFTQMRFNLKFLSSVVFAVTFLVGGFFVATPNAFAADTGFINPTVAENVTAATGIGWSGLNNSTANNALVVDT